MSRKQMPVHEGRESEADDAGLKQRTHDTKILRNVFEGQEEIRWRWYLLLVPTAPYIILLH